MKNNVFSEEQLRHAAREVVISMAACLPEVPEYTFSERFLAKMAQLVARSRETEKKNNIPKQIAVAVIAAVLAIALIIGLNPSARATIREWFRETVGDFFNYWVEEEAQSSEPMDYRPGWIPEGYELLVVDSTPTSTTYLYQNTTDPPTDWITFTYTQIDPDTPVNVIPLGESYHIEQVEIWEGCTGELIISTDGLDFNTLVWFDTDRNLAFSISTYLGEADILQIAEKIIKIPKS